MKTGLIVGTVISISVILEYLEILPFYFFPFNKERLYSFFGYQNIIAQYLIFPVLWGSGVYVCSDNHKEKILVSICVTISIIALLLTFCRGAVFAAVISGLIFSYIYIKMKGIENSNIQKYILSLVILTVIAIAGIYISNLVTEGKTIYKISIILEKGLNARMPLWTGAVDTIFDNPLNGVGLGTYIIPNKINVHNELLQIGAETGIAGIFGMLVFFIVVFKHIKNNISSIKITEVKLLYIAILLGCVATLIHSMVSYNLHSSASSFLFFAGLGILCSNDSNDVKSRTKTKKTVITNIAILFIAISVSLWGIQFEYKKIMGHYLFDRAQLLLRQNDISKSLEYSLRAVYYQPRNPKYHIWVSRMYLKNGKLELAEKHYSEAEHLMNISLDK